MDENKKKLFEVLKERQNEIMFLRNYDDARHIYGKITKFPDDETGNVEYRTVTLETFRLIDDFVTSRVHLNVNEEENTVSEFIDRVINFREPGSKRYDIEDYIVDILNARKVSYETISIDYDEFVNGHYESPDEQKTEDSELNLKLYEQLETIAREVFGDLKEENIEYIMDDHERGSSPDDIVYILTQQGKDNYGLWKVKQSLYIYRALDAAIKLYCDSINSDLYKDIKIDVSYDVVYIELENKEGDRIRVDIRTKLSFFDDSRLDKNHIKIESLVPKFMLEEPLPFVVSDDNMTLERVDYYDKTIEATFKKRE